MDNKINVKQCVYFLITHILLNIQIFKMTCQHIFFYQENHTFFQTIVF